MFLMHLYYILQTVTKDRIGINLLDLTTDTAGHYTKPDTKNETRRN
jgi:hypothetical protein